MRFSSGTSRWWVAAFLVVTLVCTTGWLILGQRLAEQTGLRRQVWLANDFQGAPVINDVAREPALNFLVDDPRLPREFISARWRGYWYVPSRRSVTLHVEADDYADIWIDGEQRFARSSAAERAVRLDAGVHELQIAYQQYAGAANLAFTGGSGDAYQLPLRTGYLFPDQPEPNLLRLVGIVDRLTLTVGILWAAGALAAAVFFILAAPTRLERPRTRITIAVLLGLLSVGHVGVFGWRSITFDRRATGRLDELHRCRSQPVGWRGAGAERRRLQSARVLGAGLLAALPRQDARRPQPRLLRADCGGRRGHRTGACRRGICHRPSGLRRRVDIHLPVRLAPPGHCRRPIGGGVPGPSAPLDLSIRTWTEPVVIALLLALLALLARGTTPRRAVGGGLLAGLALLVRSSFVPMLALGGLACLLGHGSRVRRLLLFAAGASIATGRACSWGRGRAYQPYLPRTTVAAGWFPDVFVSELWTLAAAAFLGACAWWRAVRDGRPIVPDRARYGCVLVIAWIAGWWVFLLVATRLVVMSSYVLDDRMLAPAAAVTAIASALLVWRICPERLRLSVAVVVFAATTALATAGDAIVQGDNGTARRLYASSARVLVGRHMTVGRNMTARILPADGDRSHYDYRIANFPRRLWVSRNVTPRDLVVGAGTMDLPYLFRQQVPATVSFSPFPEVSGAKFNAIFLARCDRYDNLYLILSKLPSRDGADSRSTSWPEAPAEPGTPAANFSMSSRLA